MVKSQSLTTFPHQPSANTPGNYHSIKFSVKIEHGSSIQFFCGNWSGNDNMTSFHMQFEKIGRRLLQEAFQSVGGVLC